MVEHGNESTKFLLWDCECAELIGQSVDEVNRLKIEVCYCIIVCCSLIYSYIFLFPIYNFIMYIKSLDFLLFKDGDVNLNVSPQALDRLLGCLLAFKVKVQPKFGNAVVLKYSPDLDLINFVLDMLPDSEVQFCHVCFSCCRNSNIFNMFG